MIKSLPAAATIALVSALAGSSPALGSAFAPPRTLADWGPGAEVLVAAPGAAAWTHPAGVRLSRAGQPPVRIPESGLVQEVAVGSPAGGPFAAWVDPDMRLHAFAERDEIVPGTMERVRKLEATPSALAWIGMAGADRKLQFAVRGAGGFGSARTPEQLGHPAFGLAADGHGGRSLLAWPASDGGARRIELLSVDASGASEPRWITSADHDATSPAVAMGPDGASLVAWVDGMPLGRVTAMPVSPDGALGTAQPLDSEPGGQPGAAVGSRGAAVVVWPSGGGVRAALRAPGAESFNAPVILPAQSVLGWTAAVTDDGETVVSWLDAAPGADPRQGARLLAAVAPPGGALGAPEELADHVLTVDGAADALTWVESRPAGAGVSERRVRYARLGAPAGGAGGGAAPGAGDRRAPRVKLRVVAVRGRRVQVTVRADERAALRATWRRGAKTLRRAGGTLRAGRPRVLRLTAPAGARRVTLAVKVTDASGNAATAKRTVRLRKNGG